MYLLHYKYALVVSGQIDVLGIHMYHIGFVWKLVDLCLYNVGLISRRRLPQYGVVIWKRIGVIVCKKSAYPNCSVALTNCSGTLITAPEHL